MSYEIKSNPSFISSPFGRKRREPEETLADGTVHRFKTYTNIRDYIKVVYGVNDPWPVKERFPFLDRDSADKTYRPGEVDPFVFKNESSIEKFKKEALKLHNSLLLKAGAIGLPIVNDPERSVKKVDTSKITNEFLSGSNSKIQEIAEMIKEGDAGYLLSNIDIMRKASLVRTVIPGWWAVSYRGKVASQMQPFKRSVDLLVSVMVKIMQSPQYKSKFDETLSSQSDPLDTAIGFPNYTAIVDAEMNPVSKLGALEQYKNICNPSDEDWDKVIDRIKERGTTDFERKFPLAICCIRRIQAGAKFCHVWQRSDNGLQWVYDERGNATNRVAWAASYLQNLTLSPVHTIWKTLRKLIPGLYHDGSLRRDYISVLKQSDYLHMESDFANWDRNIPNDVMSYFFYRFSRHLPRSDYWFGVMTQSHRNLNIVWGDQVLGSRGLGYVFKADVLGLLSGLKITSEVGTFMNLIVNITGWIKTGFMSESQIVDYLLGVINGRAKDLVPIVMIQSDDTLLNSKDPKELSRLAKAFVEGSSLAGVKAEVNFGDKFLMRHLTRGVDRPVTSRIWQNTLSNEEPVSDSLIFLVGLAMRTEGILGQRTFDPFKVDLIQKVGSVEMSYSKEVLESLLGFVSTSSQVIPEAKEYLSLLLGSSQRMQTSGKMSNEDSSSINDSRKRFLQALAFREQRDFLNSTDVNKKLATMLYKLHKDQASPNSKWRLDALQQMSPGVDSIIANISKKEEQFYVYAMKKINQSRTI